MDSPRRGTAPARVSNLPGAACRPNALPLHSLAPPARAGVCAVQVWRFEDASGEARSFLAICHVFLDNTSHFYTPFYPRVGYEP